ncbi:MAG: flagellar FlbD family protein [Planctomycetaceae bacterium]|jgi:flagellar protein FlbD|nr:flagellar FlbD family protein [Planctomycetaceae bacterium]
MIELTKLSGQRFILNAEFIRYVEECPDTLITLISGESLMVKESMQEVVRRTICYRQETHLIPVASGQREGVGSQ